MSMYKITYIDGHDSKYKEKQIDAGSKSEAIERLKALYVGDFDHQYISISIEDHLIWER